MIYNNITYRTDASFDTEIVEALPSTDLAKLNTIYFVKNNDADNTCSEYLCIEEGSTRRWELIGTTAVTLSDYVKKTDVKPLYVHNIELFYNHGLHPYGKNKDYGDGGCRASFILINHDANSYSFQTDNLQKAVNAWSNESPYVPTEVENLTIYQAWQLARLFRAIAFDATRNANAYLRPCGGSSSMVLDGAVNSSYSNNYKIGTKYFSFNLDPAEYRTVNGKQQSKVDKRLIVVYGFFTNKALFLKDVEHQSAIEISCGQYKADENGQDPLFVIETEKEFEEYLRAMYQNTTPTLNPAVDFVHQVIVVEDTVEPFYDNFN